MQAKNSALEDHIKQLERQLKLHNNAIKLQGIEKKIKYDKKQKTEYDENRY